MLTSDGAQARAAPIRSTRDRQPRVHTAGYATERRGVQVHKVAYSLRARGNASARVGAGASGTVRTSGSCMRTRHAITAHGIGRMRVLRGRLVKLGFPFGRDVYECANCMNQTARCMYAGVCARRLWLRSEWWWWWW